MQDLRHRHGRQAQCEFVGLLGVHVTQQVGAEADLDAGILRDAQGLDPQRAHALQLLEHRGRPVQRLALAGQRIVGD
ncbi:MAG: hypothetical protein IPM01_06195, partial [Burkholderiaceae bacterium]|nr:hypothetical protein [Burkholderiaceae bacterium]